MTIAATFLNNEGTRVWVKASVAEAIRNPKVNRFQRSALTSKTSHSDWSEVNSDVGSASVASTATTTATTATTHGRHQQWGWMSGIMISSNGGVTVKLDDDGDTVRFPESALRESSVVLDNEYNRDAEGNVIYPDDLITLTHLHEPAVVHCLQNRYCKDIIYTATGPVLLALNPFKTVRQLYGEQAMKRYWDKAEKNTKDSLPPHVFAIADASFRSMMRQIDESLGSSESKSKANQSILVSGESGAGKTVTTKFVMKYLAALSQRAATSAAPAKRAYLQAKELQKAKSPDRPGTAQPSWALNSRANSSSRRSDVISFSSNSIESKVLQSNPILESFGNARTLRNDNSSRFGKFIEIQFTENGKLVGANIETYLLEKVRLITQAYGERNYHVFFEILSGMESRELRQYYLAKTATPDDFALTNSGTFKRRDGIADKDTYKSLRSAMNTMKFSAQEQKSIFSVTAAILHASNLQFLELDDDQSSLDSSNIHLGPVCQLLGVTPRDLSQALCTFSIQAGRDGAVRRSLSREKSEKGLEALLKATYGALFQYLVQRINDSIACKADPDDNVSGSRSAATIGVLDIFGFESFTTNSFEQLCINYCNEALQQQFNAFVLKNEQEEYEREGIEWSFIEFPENQDVLDMIDKRGSGILNILDDQCRAPGTTDRSFAADVFSKCKGNSRFAADRKQVAGLQFVVHHYAGPVEYTATGFVEKNRDELPKEACELLNNSTNVFLQLLGKILTQGGSPGLESKSLAPYSLRRVESSSVSRPTVGGQFRKQLRELRSKIDQTVPHYVRCLKPNDNLVPDHFDPVIIAEQLRCGGILEAVRVSRAGFTQHYPHADFYRRYRCIAVKELHTSTSKTTPSNWNVASPSNSGRSTWGNSRGTPHSRWNTVPTAGRYGTPAPKSSTVNADSPQPDMKASCKSLLKILLKKVQKFEADEVKENTSTDPNVASPATPSAKAKSYSKYTSPAPSWSKVKNNESPSVKSRYQPRTRIESPVKKPVPEVRTTGFRRGPADLTKMGIQMGKTKVFLRHKAFESLERMRSLQLSKAATRVNSIFRMYLSRLAYIPVRNAYRQELRDRGLVEDEHKEDPPPTPRSHSRVNSQRFTQRGATAASLIAIYDSYVRASIHNPVPRNEWGKAAPKKLFKWVLVDGIWVRNQSPFQNKA